MRKVCGVACVVGEAVFQASPRPHRGGDGGGNQVARTGEWQKALALLGSLGKSSLQADVILEGKSHLVVLWPSLDYLKETLHCVVWPIRMVDLLLFSFRSFSVSFWIPFDLSLVCLFRGLPFVFPVASLGFLVCPCHQGSSSAQR